MQLSKKKEFEKRLSLLEAQRETIRKRELILIPVLVLISIALFAYVFFYHGLNENSLTVIPVTMAFAYGIRLIAISDPFRKLKEKFKTMVLKEYMDIFHPKMNFSYSQKSVHAYNIIKNSDLISVSDYGEEDVIQGQQENLKFYISEVELGNTDSEGNKSIKFRGMLFHLIFENKTFPKSAIQSNLDWFTSWFSNYTKNKEYDFHYYTDDDALFQKELKYIFPFIKYYVQRNSDLRLSAKKNRITLLLKTNMRFLDSPKFSLDKPLFSEKYLEVMTMQLNTLFYIIEAFANNLEKKEIEKRIEKIIYTSPGD